jgi:membrane protease YdiL (CAAX protease family)
LGLAVPLIGVGLALASLVYLVNGRSTVLFRGLELVPLALAIASAQVLVNGLPEEFVYRGAIFGRLLHWLRRPHAALVFSSILFVSSHIPSYIAQGIPPIWLFALVSPGIQPTGLIWGYLCYRTRSIWPGVIWHSTGWVLGITFM